MIVIGAGFAGLSAAKFLTGKGMQVMIVDRHNFHTFQPLLYQVATAGLDVSDVAYPVRTIFRGRGDFSFRQGEVRQVDLDSRRLVLGDGSVLDYDHLIVATGATAGFFGITGAAERAHPLYTLGDARKLRNLILSCLEDSEAHPARHDGGAPCFVVVGGGATGVETAGAIIELLTASRKSDMVKVDWERTRVVMIDSNEGLLTGFHERAGKYAHDDLAPPRCGRHLERPGGRGQRRPSCPRGHTRRRVGPRRPRHLGGWRDGRRDPGVLPARAEDEGWTGRSRRRSFARRTP